MDMGGSRKRKKDNNNVEEHGKRRDEKEQLQQQQQKDDDDDNEEENMEKFFALIRSTREMHDLIRRGSQSHEIPEDGKEKKSEAVAAWNPSFQPEDFTGDHVKHSNEAGPSKTSEQQQEEKHKKEEEGGDTSGLDLNLSL